MRKFDIPYARQDINQDDIDSVVTVLKSNWITQGPAVPDFESLVASVVGAKYAVAVNSATSALHIACLALGVNKDDVVWTTPNTFVASANSALYCGASVDFVDIDPDTLCMSTVALQIKLEHAIQTGCTLPRVIIPVHFGGQSCDMASINMLAKKYGFYLIEDASHAVGGFYETYPVGSSFYSDITVFSFHPAKIITTGEGGMALTNNAELASKMNLLRSHGITRDPEKMTDGASGGPWYYQQIDLGFNYRLTDMQAALGKSQMSRLANFVEVRNKLADRYDRKFKAVNINIQKVPLNVLSARHLYVVRVAAEQRSEVFKGLQDLGIGANVHYIPVHLQPWYKKMGFKEGQFPEAERYYSEAITLPLYAKLTEVEQDYVIDCVQGLLK
ncbi:UDP-4-amino-4,6-dideoxy-N-acetyl-beta-L-altrosamine transaminase [Polynucleobacter paneuropaeus]|nr:UDP-4-amino-4,6-dideoxy-N-acetyl-beta-L-altrosamine transaminase [Polynucleobacter paneuropaeus]